MREIDGEEGVKINRINVNNLQFADDIDALPPKKHCKIPWS